MLGVFGGLDLEVLRAAAVFTGAVAVDAVALTVCDFEANARLRRAVRWALWVTLAHWGLAGLGLSGVWSLRASLPMLGPWLQGATVVLLCVLMVQMLAEARGRSRPGAGEGRLGFAAKVWVVSVDALFVGAGQSAAAEGWTGRELAAVLLLMGPMILACLAGAVAAARRVAALVGRGAIGPERVFATSSVGLPAVALPLFAYLLLSALRGVQLV